MPSYRRDRLDIDVLEADYHATILNLQFIITSHKVGSGHSLIGTINLYMVTGADCSVRIDVTPRDDLLNCRFAMKSAAYPDIASDSASLLYNVQGIVTVKRIHEMITEAGLHKFRSAPTQLDCAHWHLMLAQFLEHKGMLQSGTTRHLHVNMMCQPALETIAPGIFTWRDTAMLTKDLWLMLGEDMAKDRELLFTTGKRLYWLRDNVNVAGNEEATHKLIAAIAALGHPLRSHEDLKGLIEKFERKATLLMAQATNYETTTLLMKAKLTEAKEDEVQSKSVYVIDD